MKLQDRKWFDPQNYLFLMMFFSNSKHVMSKKKKHKEIVIKIVDLNVRIETILLEK